MNIAFTKQLNYQNYRVLMYNKQLKYHDDDNNKNKNNDDKTRIGKGR